MKKLLLILAFLIPFIGVVGQTDEWVVNKTWAAYKPYARIVDNDGGTYSDTYDGVRLTKSYMAMAEKNGIADSIKFAWLSVGASSTTPNGTYSYLNQLTKAYSFYGTNHATQTTPTSQLFVCNNVADNEHPGMLNPTGGSRFITITPALTVTGTYTITKCYNDNSIGKTLVAHTEVTSGTISDIVFTGKMYAYVVRGGAMSTEQKAAEAAFIQSIYPEIFSVNIEGYDVESSNFDAVSSSNGTVIYDGNVQSTWATDSAAFWCYHTDIITGAIYGKLYNKQARDVIIANPPNGWHVATETELTAIALNGGNKLKKEGTNYWNTTGGTNYTGFSAIGGASRNADGTFATLKNTVTFWTSDSFSSAAPDNILSLNHNDNTAIITQTTTNKGHSIRLVRDILLENQDWYGVERDLTIASPDWTRIASSPAAMSLHATLPVQNSLKGVVLNADRTVNYYLNPTDWTKKADGSASNLTGADGNVMVHKDCNTYWQFETVGNIQRVKCSIYPLAGFFILNPDRNFGAYEGSLISTKLSSVAGVLPITSRSETQFRADARANGAGYNQIWNGPNVEIAWMQIVEFASFNIQKPVDNTLTVEGYRKGGLGNGVTTAVSAEWSAFNGYNPFITCGASDPLGNGTGEVSISIANFGGAGVDRTFTVPRYRGIENPFGHIWKWVDGVSFNHLADRRECYIFDDPSLIADNTSVNARFAGNIALDAGWVKTILFGTKGDIIGTTVGGSSTTQFCDYLYVPALNSGWRTLFFGGTAYDGANAGRYAYSNYGASNTGTAIGARLSAR